MITDKQLRDALHRAAGSIDGDLDAAEDRVRRAAGVSRAWRLPLVVAAAAVIVVAAVVVPGLLGGQPDRPAPTEVATSLPSAGALPAGTYRLAHGFGDPLALTVGEGWTVALSGTGDIRLHPPGAPASVIGVVAPRKVFDSRGRSAPAPYDLTTWLKTRPTLTVDSSGGTPVGSLFGTRLDITTKARTPLFDQPGGRIALDEGSRSVLVSVNDSGRFVIFYVTGPASEAEAASAAFDDLLAGIRLPS